MSAGLACEHGEWTGRNLKTVRLFRYLPCIHAMTIKVLCIWRPRLSIDSGMNTGIAFLLQLLDSSQDEYHIVLLSICEVGSMLCTI